MKIEQRQHGQTTATYRRETCPETYGKRRLSCGVGYGCTKILRSGNKQRDSKDQSAGGGVTDGYSDFYRYGTATIAVKQDSGLLISIDAQTRDVSV